MASKIEWTEEVWNPVVGCSMVSEGCRNCYAVGMTHRLGAMAEAAERRGENPGKKMAAYKGLTVLNGRGDRHFTGQVRTVEEALSVPLKRKTPTVWFVNSMGDLFHKGVPFEFIDKVFAVMALCPQHTFQVLTKRPERMAEYMEQHDGGDLWHAAWSMHLREMVALEGKVGSDEVGEHPRWIEVNKLCDQAERSAKPLPNVWLGTSVEDQAAADERIPHLLRCPAAVRFLSMEPLLGDVDFSAYFGGEYVGLPGDVVHPNYNHGVCWVIVGGESGGGARPCSIDWIRSIIGQCKAAGVPCFVKQLGSKPTGFGQWPDHPGNEGYGCTFEDEGHKLASSKGGDWSEWPEDLRVREMPDHFADANKKVDKR